MDTKQRQELNNQFYQVIEAAVKKFINTDENKDVYALVFDCEEDTGDVFLRYANERMFQQEMLPNWDRWADMFEPYGKYGLRGLKYAIGDFKFIDYDKGNGLLDHFLQSYYFYEYDRYSHRDDEPMDIKDDHMEIWEDMILACINRLKENLEGLNMTEDFIVFMCGHDQSYEGTEEYIKRTVPEPLFTKLLKESEIKDVMD